MEIGQGVSNFDKAGKMDKNEGLKTMKFLVCVLVAGLFFLVACSDKKSKEPMDSKALAAVALEYWKNRLTTRDYQATYSREMKGGLVTFEEYSRLVSQNEKFLFSALKVLNPIIENHTGRLEIILMAKGPGMPAAFERTFKDVWTYSDPGEWHHQFKKNQP
jgi:hypothetical protein